MSIAQTVPEFWSNLINGLLSERFQALNLVNNSYEGEIRNAGDTVNIMTPSEINVGTYSGADVTVQALNPSVAQLVVDQEKYAAFAVDSLDEIQSAMALKEAGISRASNRLADDIDAYILSLYGDAGSTYNESGSAWTFGTDASQVTEFLAGLVKEAEEADIPTEGLTIIAPPVFRQALTMHYGAKSGLVADEAQVRGAMGTYAGVDVVISNNLVVASNAYDCLTFSKGVESGIASAQQLLAVEEVPNTLKRGNIVKMFSAYGAKVYDSSRVINARIAEVPLA